jgi:hypothetical protein
MRFAHHSSIVHRLIAGAAIAQLGVVVLGALMLDRATAADGDAGLPRAVALQQDSAAGTRNGKGGVPTDKPPRKGVTKPQAAAGEKVAAEKEVAVRKFVDQHHPELAAVLNHLKDYNAQEYQRAVRDLSRVVDRLSLARERDRRRYELELKQWQNQSRIDLLTARIKMANAEDYREPMRTLLRERLDLKTALLQLERERLGDRVQKLDQQLQSLSGEPDAMVESQLRVILGANKPAKPAKEAGPAKKKSST